jgi:hypothetical protein
VSGAARSALEPADGELSIALLMSDGHPDFTQKSPRKLVPTSAQLAKGIFVNRADRDLHGTLILWTNRSALMLELAAGRVSRTELLDGFRNISRRSELSGAAGPPAAVLAVARQRAESGLVLRLSHRSPGRRMSRSRGRPAADGTLLDGTAP